MNKTPRDWMGEITTGHGAMILAPTLLAVASEAMTWETAAPLLAAGLIGLIWPERRPMAQDPGKDAQAGAAHPAAAPEALHHPASVHTVVAAYRLGIDHATSQDPGPIPSKPTLVPPLVRGLAVLIATGLTIGACMQPEKIGGVVDIDTTALARAPNGSGIGPAATRRP